jgi:hypothetical protein
MGVTRCRHTAIQLNESAMGARSIISSSQRLRMPLREDTTVIGDQVLPELCCGSAEYRNSSSLPVYKPATGQVALDY